MTKQEKQEHNDKEWLILIALFKSTVEQQSMLLGVEKQRAKMVFNTWNRQGASLLKRFERVIGEEALEVLSEKIEEAANEVRNGIEVVD